MKGIVLGVVLVVAACGSPSAATAQSSPSGTTSASPTATPSVPPQPLGLDASVGAGCSAINATRKLALVWMDWNIGGGTVFVRDLTNVADPKNICGIDVRWPSGPPRFLTATTVSVPSSDGLYELDLLSGKSQRLAAWALPRRPIDCCGLAGYDVATDTMSVAYVVVESIPTSHPTITTWVSTATFHLASGGFDRVLGAMTVNRSISVGEARVDFSPSGKYVALGLTGSSGDGTMAPVQVRALDSQLVFASAGTAALTWAGSGDHLFYDSGAGIRRWDGGQTSTEVLSETWVLPNASADRRYIAYVGAHLSSQLTAPVSPDGTIKYEHTGILNVATSTSTDVPSPSGGPVFMTPSLIFHDRRQADGGVDFWEYNMADGTDSRSSVDAVFSTWPRGTPAWGFSS